MTGALVTAHKQIAVPDVSVMTQLVLKLQAENLFLGGRYQMDGHQPHAVRQFGLFHHCSTAQALSRTTLITMKRYNGSMPIMIVVAAFAANDAVFFPKMLSVTYSLTDRIGIRAGYHILEGGADNDEVYNYSLFHYATAGLSYFF